jgi:hypothetical protein
MEVGFFYDCTQQIRVKDLKFFGEMPIVILLSKMAQVEN